MVLTNDVHLPEESELTVPEVNLSAATLMASSFHLGKYCEHANNEFMLCRIEENDPRKCINEGKVVTACTMEFFRKVKQTCLSEFDQYANCVDKSSGDFSLSSCRKTQGVFDKCMLDKLQLERPGFGYFTEARVHDTKRPKPQPEPKTIYTDPTPALPDAERDAARPARHGSRFYWMTE
ncbi:NADH dehydrogenase [ubiquinone] 1 alpha subcomplex subunit 8 isoform X2 [Ostrinia furnacalis]|uniref:NADH dehydrogenase [ubiquinone] 1 alpha subcomplex subunit 8 isoform X1 n=1 Tax=Ostrinia furnacalis TaxID=93504 RepID=UPI001038DC18|nr:NADH dehydrogenase [ubiquinone] 1 alpha subcomplex subunit 8 isoform X1 [Ostrinia furnacalis]XP_028162298.1 NADH dehydrogenase [ubiquinone] 1 alpha subcomplex subunit 8 isoform X2 [Ostrinia furnacalis]